MGGTKKCKVSPQIIQNPAGRGEINRNVSEQNQWHGCCSGRTTKALARPKGFDLKAWQSRSFGVWQEDVHAVVWRFTPAATAEARRFLFHLTEELTEEPVGRLIVRF
jgi:hypothetical protein